MSYPVAKYQIESATRRGFQPGVWQDALDQFVPGNVNLGVLEFDDFHKVVNNTTDASAANGWFIQDMAAGGTSESFIQKAGEDGLATLSAATGTAHFGIELQRAAAATTGGTVILPGSSNGGKGVVCFDVRLTVDKSEHMFVGLTESIASFYSATTTKPADSDYIGFELVAGGSLSFVCANDNAGGTAVTDSATLLATGDITDGATYRLGFRVGLDNKVTICINDKIYTVAGDSINPLALPIELLTPRICLGRGAGSDTTVSSDIDYIATFVGADSNG